ncbi:replication protein [Priestia megaterium]|uniref:replication protein n=1 Tax=Priestia megaterium TaxID=1404 RepID=UPI0018695BB3|nr:replication protein [Priestia megaterium]MBE2973392.1 replication protein [Priestia megaterium]
MKINNHKNFTKINNEILENIVKFKFNGTQLRILMVVWRYTYGYQRASHELSINFIANSINIDRTRVKNELKTLIQNNAINVIKEGSFTQTRVIKFNDNYDEWKIQQCGNTKSQEVKNTPGTQKNCTTVDKNLPSSGDKINPQQRKEKENYKEKIYTSLFEHWNSKKIIVHRLLNQKRRSAIRARLNEGYTVKDMHKAISNYSDVLKSEQHYYTYKFNLEDFIKPKNMDRFLDVNNPFASLMKNEYLKEENNERFNERDEQYDELF